MQAFNMEMFVHLLPRSCPGMRRATGCYWLSYFVATYECMYVCMYVCMYMSECKSDRCIPWPLWSSTYRPPPCCWGRPSRRWPPADWPPTEPPCCCLHTYIHTYTGGGAVSTRCNKIRYDTMPHFRYSVSQYYPTTRNTTTIPITNTNNNTTITTTTPTTAPDPAPSLLPAYRRLRSPAAPCPATATATATAVRP